MKTCTRCALDLDEGLFPWTGADHTKRQGACKTCLKAARTKYTIECVSCGVAVTVSKKGASYCLGCSTISAASAKRGVSKKPPLDRCKREVTRWLKPVGVCSECSLPYHKRTAKHRFCSRQCQQRVRARAKYHAIKARYGLFDPPAHVRYHIYDRDQWLCHLCGNKVETWRGVSHPLLATLGHIVPRSLGGSDDESNLRTAHMGCNSKRGNKLL